MISKINMEAVPDTAEKLVANFYVDWDLICRRFAKFFLLGKVSGKI